MGEGERRHRARHGHGHGQDRGAAGGSAVDPSRPEVPGLELGDLIARGATSEVWAGVEVGSGRRVAVKVVAAGLGALDAAAREASLSARASSAHVVAVEACLPLADGRVALVMPHVRGGALDALVRARGHLAPGEVVTVLAPLASALGRLHDLGVVHGDVSPGNVLLELDGRPVLADLGLGHVIGEVSPGVWGTDGYVAPEVLMGADPGPAADVYALGALGWLCLSGQVPGPPGLRPSLAEVSRAGEGSEGVVAALEGAVAPLVADRPTAHELAWQLFHAARAEPLHLVRGDDETSAVTYRLRAAAGRPPEDEARVPWRARLVPARARAVGDRVGRTWHRRVVALRRRAPSSGGVEPPGGTAAAPPAAATDGWSPPSPGWSPAAVLGGGARHARPSGPRHRRRVLVAAAALAASVLVASAAAVGILPLPGSSARALGPLVDRPSASPAPAAPADVRLDPQAPRDRPGELLAALAESRARAWREATPAHLNGADAPGSAAHARDQAAITALARSGLRYEGLRYVVHGAAVVAADDAGARVRARIDTGAYRVVGPMGATERPATTGEEVVLTLVRTEVGWRVSDVTPST